MFKSVNESFKNLDVFGYNINFKIKGNDQYKTIFGSLISIICGALIVITTLFFGQNFYLRKNPTILTEDIKSNDFRVYNITAKDFILPFRLEDAHGYVLPNFKDYFNICIKHINIKYNPDTKETESYEYIYKPVKCNDKLIPNSNFSKNKNLSEWLCIPLDSDSNLNNHTSKEDLNIFSNNTITEDEFNTNNIKYYSTGKNKYNNKNGMYFGGEWGWKYLHYFSISITNCSPNSKVCTRKQAINKYFSQNAVYFSMFYPSLFTLPNDYNNMFHIKYINHFYSLSPYVSKVDRIYYKHNYLEDDVGWIFKDVVYFSIISNENIKGDISLINNNYDGEGLLQFYNFNVYYSSDYVKYSRSFMKLQELAALVGGFMEMIVFVCQIIVCNYNYFLLKYNIINDFFDNIVSDKKKANNSNKNNNNNSSINSSLKKQVNFNLFKNNKDNNSSYSNDYNYKRNKNDVATNYNLNEVVNTNNLNIMLDKDTKVNTKHLNDSNHMLNISKFKSKNSISIIEKINDMSLNASKLNNERVLENKSKSIEDISKYEIISGNIKKISKNNCLNSKDISSNIKSSSSNSSNSKNSKKSKDNIKISMNYIKYLFYYITCKSKKNTKTNKYYHYFFKAENLVLMKLDIYSYLNLTSQFEYLKELLLNNEQNSAFSYLKNPDIKNNEDINKYLNLVHNSIINENSYFKRSRTGFSNNKYSNYDCYKIDRILKYYNNKLCQGSMDHKDKFIYNNLREDLSKNVFK